LPISDDQRDYAQGVEEQLRAAGLRVEIDARAESIGKKIRDAQQFKIPVMLIIGKKEAAAQTVALRTRAGGDEGATSVTDVIASLTEQVQQRA